MDKTFKTLIIIPAYNEEETIGEVVKRAMKYADVCVIDDCSSDTTPEILAKIEGIHIIKHSINTHIPGAIIDGMKYAVENNYACAISMDAGLSHNPDEIPLFLEHPQSDLLIGIRTTKRNTPLFRKCLSMFGNITYNLCLNFPKTMPYKKHYRDLTSGFRRYSFDAMKLLISKEIQSKTFEFMLESALYIHKSGMIISEVPINYNFSNSSLNYKVISNCINMSLKHLLRNKFPSTK